MRNEDIGDAERIAAFVQLAMDEARGEALVEIATLRARVASLEAALRDVLYCNTDLMRCGRCRETARAALAPRSERREGEP